MRFFSHRGGMPENSKEAFLQSITNPDIFGIECDVQFSLDHEPVVYHDQSLLRLHKVEILVHELTLKELQQISILSLENVLNITTPKTTVLDIKYLVSTEQEIKLKNIIKNFSSQKIIVASFDEIFLNRWALTPRLYLISNRVANISWNHSFEYVGISSEVATEDYIHKIRCHHYRVQIFVYTVNDKKTLEKLCLLPVDGIISDVVPYLLS